MTQAQFDQAFADKLGVSKKLAQTILAKQAELITDTLIADQDNPVIVRDIGRFKIVHRKAREGRNPRTGEPMDIAASSKFKFLPNRALRQKVEAAIGGDDD